MKLHLLAPVLALCGLCACSIESSINIYGDGAWTIKGVKLEHRRAVVVPIAEWHAQGLSADLRAGALVVQGGAVELEGGVRSDRVELELLEVSPNDASVYYEGGRLDVRSASGQPCAMTNVRIYCSDPLAQLNLANDMGPLTLRELVVEGDCRIEADMDDVVLSQVEVAGSTVLDLDMGSLTARDCTLQVTSIEADMDDVTLERVTADQATLDLDMGEVRLIDCVMDELEVSADMGDIHATRLVCEDPSFEADMGEVTLD